MSNKFITPVFHKDSFTCPHCDVFAKQDRSRIYGRENGTVYLATCQHCSFISIWYGNKVYLHGSSFVSDEGKMYYPKKTNIPLPNEDLSTEIKQDYLEAAKIIQDSPRGACALLRLALQKLMIQLGESGEDVNKDIANLVKKGLNVTIQQALDTVRIIGNESVHPGVLDLKDDIDTANKIFGLINIIGDYLITQPKKIQEMYGSLPQEKLDGIKTRDIQKK